MRKILLVAALSFLIFFTGQGSASPYFYSYNFKDEQPTETLCILHEFKTYQQTTDYSCAAACVKMLEGYMGKQEHSEAELLKLMSINPQTGVTTDQLASFLVKQGWHVEKASSKRKLNDYTTFLDFVESNLQLGRPIFVESCIWGGHWRLIIGVDKRNTDAVNDDVLIMADPMDIADDCQDGYTIVNAGQFFYSWFDANMGPTHRVRQWVVAY